MSIKNLMPWKSEKEDVKDVAKPDSGDPFLDFEKRVNHMFSDFFGNFGEIGFLKDRSLSFSPTVDVSENAKEVVISAELPGLDEKDVDVSLSKNTLTIKGEKRSESEDKGKDYHRSERSYGFFQRTIALPCEVDESRVDARFNKGVLKIVLPKSERALQERKKIEVKSA